jgi:phosphate transport system substrate-binding protein
MLKFIALFAVSVLFTTPVLSEELVIPGSGNPEFVLGELANAFNARQTTHRIVIPSSTGVAGAIRDVSEGISTLGRVGRPLTEAESAKGLVYMPLGREAIVAVAGAGVAVQGISSAQLVDIFAGKITNWAALGGKTAPIRAIGKESSDSIRRQLSARFKDMVFADSVKTVHLDTFLIELLDRYPTSFAVINRSALGACKTKVAILALDGVQPTVENVSNGSYPLLLEFGLIHKSNGLSPAGKAFIEFIRSPEGAKIFRMHGVLAKNTNG